MSTITPIINLIGDLDTYADELDGEEWHNAANGCRAAVAEIERLREALQRILDLNYGNESAKFIAEAALSESIYAKPST